MIKESILQDITTISNVYMPNDRASEYMRQKLTELQGEIDESTIIVGDINTSLSEMGRFSGQKINKDIVELYNTIEWLDIIDIPRVLHSTRAEYTFVSCSHGTFTKTEHILGHKIHLNKF